MSFSKCGQFWRSQVGPLLFDGIGRPRYHHVDRTVSFRWCTDPSTRLRGPDVFLTFVITCTSASSSPLVCDLTAMAPLWVRGQTAVHCNLINWLLQLHQTLTVKKDALTHAIQTARNTEKKDKQTFRPNDSQRSRGVESGDTAVDGSRPMKLRIFMIGRCWIGVDVVSFFGHFLHKWRADINCAMMFRVQNLRPYGGSDIWLWECWGRTESIASTWIQLHVVEIFFFKRKCFIW